MERTEGKDRRLVAVANAREKSDTERLAGGLPAMAASHGPHIERLTEGSIGMLPLVARTVRRGEVRRMPPVQNAADEEGRKLRDMKCWGETKAFEYDDIRHKALKEGTMVHFGRIIHIRPESTLNWKRSFGHTQEEWRFREIRQRTKPPHTLRSRNWVARDLWCHRRRSWALGCGCRQPWLRQGTIGCTAGLHTNGIKGQ